MAASAMPIATDFSSDSTSMFGTPFAGVINADCAEELRCCMSNLAAGIVNRRTAPIVACLIMARNGQAGRSVCFDATTVIAATMKTRLPPHDHAIGVTVAEVLINRGRACLDLSCCGKAEQR
jgi:hypothetical protein